MTKKTQTTYKNKKYAKTFAYSKKKQYFCCDIALHKCASLSYFLGN